MRLPSRVLVSLRRRPGRSIAYVVLLSLTLWLLGMSGLPGWSPLAMVLLPALAFVVTGALAFLPQHVTIAADGIQIRWLGSRFVSSRDVADVLPLRETRRRFNDRAGKDVRVTGVRLTLRDGRVVDLVTRTAPVGTGPDPDASVLLDCLREKLGVSAPTDSPPIAAVLARDGRDAKAWVAALRAVGRNESGYREASASTELLWATFETADADPSVRVAAAIALRARVRADAEPRIRAALGEIAAPLVRVALEAVADDADDALLEQTLEPLGIPTSSA